MVKGNYISVPYSNKGINVEFFIPMSEECNLKQSKDNMDNFYGVNLNVLNTLVEPQDWDAYIAKAIAKAIASKPNSTEE